VAGLALATALWSGVQAINAEARSSYDEAAATLGQDQLGAAGGRDGGPVAIADYVALRRAGYRVSPVITGELRDESGRLRLIGIDVFTAPEEANAPLPGDDAEAAAFLGEGLLLMSEATAKGASPRTCRRSPSSTPSHPPPRSPISRRRRGC
jgi:putative ABC transport system permease protein